MNLSALVSRLPNRFATALTHVQLTAVHATAEVIARNAELASFSRALVGALAFVIFVCRTLFADHEVSRLVLKTRSETAARASGPDRKTPNKSIIEP